MHEIKTLKDIEDYLNERGGFAPLKDIQTGMKLTPGVERQFASEYRSMRQTVRRKGEEKADDVIFSNEFAKEHGNEFINRSATQGVCHYSRQSKQDVYPRICYKHCINYSRRCYEDLSLLAEGRGIDIPKPEPTLVLRSRLGFQRPLSEKLVQ